MFSRSTDPGSGQIARAASLGLLIAGWALAAFALDDPLTLPGPVEVAGRIWAEAQTGELALHVLATLGRVTAAFVLAMGTGLALGLWMGRSRRADSWLDNILVVFLNLPALVVIVLCYLWIGLTETAAVVAVALNKIPMVTVLIREGARTLDPQLQALTQVYAPPRLVVLRHVILPQMAPQIAAAARSGIALIWKIVLVVEFLGRPNGVGFQIHLGFQLFDVSMVLAYALSFVVVMLTVEAALLRPSEAMANRWRTA